MSKKALIFDFDGTIADSFAVFLEVLSAITKRPQQLSAKEIEDLRRLSTKEVIKKLGIKPWQIPLFLLKGRREIGARMERIQVFEGVPDIIQRLASKYSIYILSTNSEENISAFLDRHQLRSLIANIYGNIGLMNKAKSLQKLQKQEALSTFHCVYIGDETRDIEAARKVGMKSVAVTWGYNSLTALEACGPDALVDTPRDLYEIIQNKIL